MMQTQHQHPRLTIRHWTRGTTYQMVQVGTRDMYLYVGVPNTLTVHFSYHCLDIVRETFIVFYSLI